MSRVRPCLRLVVRLGVGLEVGLRKRGFLPEWEVKPKSTLKRNLVLDSVMLGKDSSDPTNSTSTTSRTASPTSPKSRAAGTTSTKRVPKRKRSSPQSPTKSS